MMTKFPIDYMELEAIYSKTLGEEIGNIAVVSAEGGEGVTTLALALARRAASAGKRTLLVDMNMASPSLAGLFKATGGDWLPEGEAWRERILENVEPRLDLLPAPARADSWTFRDAAKLRSCLERWREFHDCVVIDTSPLNRSNRGNIPPGMLAAVSDGTILVTLAGRTTEGQVLEARDRLTTSGAVLLGTVLNDRFMPHLADELCRETYRLERWFPNLMERLRGMIRASALLNQEI